MTLTTLTLTTLTTSNALQIPVGMIDVERSNCSFAYSPHKGGVRGGLFPDFVDKFPEKVDVFHG